MADHGKRAGAVTRVPRSAVARGTTGKQVTPSQTNALILATKPPSSGGRKAGASKGNSRSPVRTSDNSVAMTQQPLRPSIFSRPPAQTIPAQALPAVRGQQLEHQCGITQRPAQKSTIKVGPTASSLTSYAAPTLYSFPGQDQRTQYFRWLQQYKQQASIHALGRTSTVGCVPTSHPPSIPGIPNVLIKKFTSGPSGSYVAPAAKATSVQQYRLQQTNQVLPFRTSGSSSNSLASFSSCHVSPACSSPVFTSAVAHGRSAVSDIPLHSFSLSSLVPSSDSTSQAGSQKSLSTSASGVPGACCGFPVQVVSVSQLFTGHWQAPEPAPSRPEVNCQSAIAILQSAEEEATAVVLAAQERARALRAKARGDAEAEGQRLRESMEASLEALAEKHKNERERQQEIQDQADAEMHVILAKDKRENLRGTVHTIVEVVLMVDVGCPIEAIKVFGAPEQLFAFKKKTFVLHHPSGELLLQPEDYITWDEEGRALLERDASRHRPSFGSFWTKHQSRVHASQRPAVLLRPPSFVDPLDRDLSRRLPSLWEPQSSSDFQPFKLPSFAASPSSAPSSESSDSERKEPEDDASQAVVEREIRSPQDPSNNPSPDQKPEGDPARQHAKR